MNRSFFVVLSLALSSLLGCANPAVVQGCNVTCNRYKDCFDASYNVSACMDRCVKQGDTQEGTRKVGLCETCVRSRACTEALFACAVDCGGIVP